ncbi:MAG: penicillin-binding protein 1C [Bacteroidia bacterium]|nr:penicillin-binding protein 1C [Bacteroidia bacterium]
MVLLWMSFLIVLCCIISTIIIFPPHYPLSYSSTIVDYNHQVIAINLSKDQKWRLRCNLQNVPSYFLEALLYKEDKYFYYHPGVNPFAVARALWNNLKTGKRTSGASTITMQVIRLLHPKKRTYAIKILEMLRALQLELLLSKREILSLYLELLPYGGNIEGVEAASWAYFQKPLKALNIAELTTLVIIPNQPEILKPTSAGNTNRILNQRNKWLQKLAAKKIFSSSMLPVYLQEPLFLRRHNFPKNAPHFSNKISNAYPNNPYLHTTLCLQKQRAIEQIVQNYASHISLRGIYNAAALVVDNTSAEIIAYIGSHNFEDNLHQGQVDGIQAVRSPGSTLKPLIYALGIDSGIITPKTVLLDVPLNYRGYSPENYDDQFRGKVTATFALANSLNIPAVWLLQKLETPTLIRILEEANFQNIRMQKNKLGLSMILGGCGVSLYELVGLYTAFANQGIFRPLKMLKTESKVPAKRLFSAQAAYLITEILTQHKRPDLPEAFELTPDLPKVAWKTGTSYGRRDAWSIGYTPRYTVGVWCGNFSGVGNPALSGAEIATPLLFEIFRYLESFIKTPSWFLPPNNLSSREVCVETGLPPDTFCHHTTWDSYIPGISNFQLCNHKKVFWVSKDRKISYCSSCLPSDGSFYAQMYNVYPPELLHYYLQTKISLELPPPHNPVCTQLLSSGGLRISSLNDGAEYFIAKRKNTRIALEAQNDFESYRLYWFVKDKFIGQCSPRERIFFTPEDSGWNSIMCVDDRGRKDIIKIRIIYY